MKCERCGRVLDEDGRCAFCTSELQNVRVMSRQEASSYQGVTIDEDMNEQEPPRAQQRTGGFSAAGRRQGIYYRQVNLNSWPGTRNSWLTRIAIGLGLAVIAGFLFFVALPVVLIAAGVGIVVWFLLNLFSSRR